MKTITLVRKDKVKSHTPTSNQCRSVGWTDFEYDVRITTSIKLDDSGFIIDHNPIHEAIEYVMNNKMGSCEQIVINVEEELRKILVLHGCDLKKLYFAIKAEGASAWVEIEVDYTKTISPYCAMRLTNTMIP